MTNKHFIEIKPLSTNEAWKGRRFKSQLYKDYEKELYYLLPPHIDIPEGKLEIHYIFYFKNSHSDIDNPVKMFQDVLCKKYGFNDNRIFKITIEKIVSKNTGVEFVIKEYNKINICY